jgi:hypothetical protein
LKNQQGSPLPIFLVFYKCEKVTTVTASTELTNQTMPKEKSKKQARGKSHTNYTKASAIFFLALIQTRPISSLKGSFH